MTRAAEIRVVIPVVVSLAVPIHVAPNPVAVSLVAVSLVAVSLVAVSLVAVSLVAAMRVIPDAPAIRRRKVDTRRRTPVRHDSAADSTHPGSTRRVAHLRPAVAGTRRETRAVPLPEAYRTGPARHRSRPPHRRRSARPARRTGSRSVLPVRYRPGPCLRVPCHPVGCLPA